MRPVVFGPSPLMQAALGVFKGKELGRARVRDEEDRDELLATRDRKAQSDALTLAHQTISNKLSEETLAQRQTRQARADAAAAKLRAHPEFNRDKRYGDITDPADAEHDYGADFEKEAKIHATKRALMAQGMAEDKAEAAARYDVDEEGMAAQRATAKEKRERAAADLARVKAQTALDAARAASERASGGRANTAAVTAAKREAAARRREMQSVLTRRPRASQFVDPVTRMPDAEGLAEAMTNWRADSTERKGAEEDANAELRTLVPGLRPVTDPTPPKASSEPLPTDDEIDDAADALEAAGVEATPQAIKAEILRKRKAG